MLLVISVENNNEVIWVVKGDDDHNGEYHITWDDLTLSSNNGGGGGGQARIIVVDKNGGGDSSTVQGAVDLVPENNPWRVKIHILPGVYSEKVHVPASKPLISFIGDEDKSSETVITWHDKASDRGNNGNMLGTENTATVNVESDYFCASSVTFENSVVCTAIEGCQAVAVRVAGDKSVFYKARFLGSQDTLLDEYGAHFFLQCLVQGSVDFIFGFARSLYQGCTISVVGNPYTITAQSRGSANENTGYSFLNCTLTGNGPVYLGRAWGDYSRVIFAYSEFDLDVFPDGWSDWGVPSRDSTVVFGEYKCKGRGANRRGRVSYAKELSDVEAVPYLSTTFISGEFWLRL
ncbi:Pectinesterase QRT1 [Striga hermonthica]|uniref:Pectinesterase n=1 Tax=Striga hermonthica TaxID=68872 RepID=A0A9N7NQN6_STRHE|nr:Pectinesterase QRT1 [Striga hermonthica]